jgi:hypothetical protein
MLTPSPLTAAPLAQVARYRGASAGWQPIGCPRPLPQAQRLAALVARIDPAATLRAKPV